MTDEQIIKVKKYWEEFDSEIDELLSECNLTPKDTATLNKQRTVVRITLDALSLITRQNAENERLKTFCEISQTATKYWHERAKKFESMVSQNEGVLPEYEKLIKSEARREFAERLKLHSYVVSDESVNGIILYQHCVGVNQIDNLLKEMESESE